MRRFPPPCVLPLVAAITVLGLAAPTAHAASPAEPGATTDAVTPELVDGLADPVDPAVAADAAAKAHLAGHRDRYKIADPAATLATASVARAGSRETVRLDQTFEGLPVLGAQYVVRMDTKGGKRTVTGTSGTYVNGLDVDTKAEVLSADVAVGRAVDRVRLSMHPGAVLVAGTARAAQGPVATPDLTGDDEGLVVVPNGTGVLARHVVVRGTDATTGVPVLRDVYVDAATGVPLVNVSRIKTIAAPGRAAAPARAEAAPAGVDSDPVPAPEGTTPVQGRGVRFDGTVVPVELQRVDATGEHLMIDRTHSTADGRTVPITTWDATAQDFTTTVGIWPEGIAPFSSPSADLRAELTDVGAVDAAWAAGEVFEYWKTQHGRSGLDDAGTPIDSLVGITYYGQPWVNAFWDGTKMVYATGDAEHRPMSADLDVVGHEMAHGVIEHTANFIYGGQPGALNEAFADYFGNAIDVDAAGQSMSDPGAGLIGGDLCRTLTPADCALRDLDDGMTTAGFLHLADLPVDLFDDGGVHVNSTIVSGALWDLRQAFGAEVADPIVYRALTDYLTPSSDFVDARDAVVASARSLGLQGKDLKAVVTAFESRGITAKWEDGLHGKGTDLLVDRLGTGWYAEERASSADGWYAVPRRELGTQGPAGIWVGTTDGRVPARQLSPDDGSAAGYPHVDGGRVVWLSYAGDFRILSAPLAGGPVTELYRTTANVSGLGVDGGIVAWSEPDPTTGLAVVHWTDDDARTVHTLGHDWTGHAQFPSVKDGKISYIRNELLDRAPGWAFGVEVYDTASGTTVLAGLDEGAEAMSYPALSSTGVAWMVDAVPGHVPAGLYHSSVRTYDFAHGASRLLFEEGSADALWVESVALSDTTLTIARYAPIEAWWTATGPTDAVNTTLQQYTIDGRYVGPGACSQGTQLFPAALEGRTVLYLDSGASGVGLALATGVKSCK